jgi:hypothetical protein
MSTINTILIKRRLSSSPLDTIPVLSGGELAFSEKNNTLYYGASSGTIEIGGDGAFVSRTLSQTISGDKTFFGLTTLSSTTFSTGSLIDAGGNVIGNLSVPVLSADAATKKYVDDLSSTVAQDFVDRSTNQDVSGSKTFFDVSTFKSQVNLEKGLSVTEGVSANSYNINSDIVIDSSKNASFANIDASGHLTVQGDLTVYGNSTTIETIVTVASAFSVTNTGSGPALSVTQTGANDIASFLDDSTTALIIKDGGNVGINVANPNERLTVSGNISATGNIYANGELFVDGGGVNTTFYVEDGKVGINTETPNEALTVSGNISATQNIFAVNGDFTGTLDADGATTLGSTLNVTSNATFASTVSAVGAVTLDNTLYVSQNSTFFANISGQAGVSSLIDFIIDGGSF